MSKGRARKNAIKAYLSIPKGLRSIPDEIIRNRGSAQSYLDKHSERGKHALNNMVKKLSKGKHRR